MNETIRVNGKAKPFRPGTIRDLLAAEDIDPGARFVAVAINGAVVPRGRWPDAALAAGDEVEIVRPAPGG